MTTAGSNKTSALLIAAISIALPLVLLAINPNWFFTDPFVPPWWDPFMYQGFFMHPAEYIRQHPDYYPATRIPHVALGAAFYAALPPLAANYALKVTIMAATLALFGAALLPIVGRAFAIIGILALGSYPWFIAAIGWDYIDNTVMLLTAACYAALIRGATHSGRLPLGEFAAGMAFALLVVTMLFMTVLGPMLTLLYVGILHGHGNGSDRPLRRIAFAAIGVVVGFIAAWGIYYGFGGTARFLLGPQIEATRDLGSELMLGFRLANMAWVLPSATWLIVPAATVAIALLGLTRRDLISITISVHYLFIAGAFVAITLTSMAVLTLWFYASHLVIPAFVTMIAIIARLVPVRTATVLGIVAASLALISAVFAQNPLRTSAGRDRSEGFLAVLDAANEVRGAADLKPFVWIDRQAPDLGGVFHSAFIQSWMIHPFIGDQSTRFPILPRDGLNPGDAVVILTAQPDWADLAARSLHSAGNCLEVQRIREIRRGAVKFVAVVAKIAAIASGACEPR